MAQSHSEERSSRLNIIVHDFSGHPGQVQLSRQLARRGHTVEHQFCSSFTTGQGATVIREDDPPSFSIMGIGLKSDFARYSPLQRILQELQYGWLSIRAALARRPDIAIFSNLPMLPLAMVSLTMKICRIPYVLWWQDVYSDAIGTAARKRLGILGGPVGWLAECIERGSARGAATVVPIAHEFLDCLNRWGVDRTKTTVIQNWGALDEIQPRPHSNEWSRSHGLDGVKVVMYAGTLGLKHDPSVLAELARNAPSDCRVVVVSQGKGRKWLEEYCATVERLVLLDFQPYEQVPEMLGSADILVAVLEQDASRYSVPSKVLNYFCAGRPVLGLLPSDNAVARMIEHADAGIVVPSGDRPKATEAMIRLLADHALRDYMSENALNFANQNFEMDGIADRFETVIRRALPSGFPPAEELP